MLVRYWFHVKQGLGYGVTAYSNEDARSLLATQWSSGQLRRTQIEVVGR